MKPSERRFAGWAVVRRDVNDELKFISAWPTESEAKVAARDREEASKVQHDHYFTTFTVTA